MKEHQHRVRSLLPGYFRIWLLLLLFLCALCTAAYLLFPGRCMAAAEQLRAQTPLSVPDVMLYSHVPFSYEEQDRLGTYGNLTCMAASLGQDSAGGAVFVLASPYRTKENPLFTLTSGRLPQMAGECVLLADTENTSLLGSSIPVSADDGTVQSYTVVGIAENALTAFAPYAKTADSDPIQYLFVMETGDKTLPGMAAVINGSETPQSIEEQLSAYAEAQRPAYLSALSARTDAKTAERNALLAARDAAIAQKTAAHAALAEQEQSLLAQINAESAALMQEHNDLMRRRQEFTSEMEMLEYLSTNQTTMIPRRDEAEAQFAAEEAALDARREALDAQCAAHAALQLQIETALQAIEDAKTAYEALVTPPQTESSASPTGLLQSASSGWLLFSAADPYSGYAGYSERVHAERQRFLLPMLLTLLVCTVFGFLAGRLGVRHHRRKRVFLPLYLCSTLCGAFIGAFLIPKLRFARIFPYLSAQIPLPGTTFPAFLLPFTAALFLTLLPPFAAAFLGTYMRRKKQS